MSHSWRVFLRREGLVGGNCSTYPSLTVILTTKCISRKLSKCVRTRIRIGELGLLGMLSGWRIILAQPGSRCPSYQLSCLNLTVAVPFDNFRRTLKDSESERVRYENCKAIKCLIRSQRQQIIPGHAISVDFEHLEEFILA